MEELRERESSDIFDELWLTVAPIKMFSIIFDGLTSVLVHEVHECSGVGGLRFDPQ